MKSYRVDGRRGRIVAASASLAALAAATVLPAGTASATSAGHLPSRHALPTNMHTDGSQVRGHTDVAEPGRDGRSVFPSHGPVTVMLQLDTRTAAHAYVAGKVHGLAAATSAAREQRAAIASLTRSVQSHFTAVATRATTLFTLHNVYAGIAVHTDASRISALSKLPGVKAVHAMPAKKLLNVSSVPLIKAPQEWAGADGNTGSGVKIGIIDTGIDYTHANFGGTGNPRAYDQDHAVADSPTLNVPSGDFPSAKVVGGTDLVGDGYDASSTDAATATPHPDPNPLDCNSHGSHVAGSAAGYGVNSDGSTFTGDYSTLAGESTDQYRSMFRIGPGVAPEADLYAIRVFGCEGSTSVVSEALDWAADPNGDGNMKDHLDVVNMSLGSDYGVPDDPDSVASNNASILGITVVAAAGNGGDLVAVGGSPGNASRVIGVAASQDALTVYDAMQENTPDSQKIAGQRSVLYDWADNGPVTGDVVPVNPAWAPGDDIGDGNADGCDPFTAEQAAAVKGKIAWEEWTDGVARRCGSLTAAGNAEAAGAIGVILTDDENTFAAGINGAEHIPTFQIRKVDADALRPAADGGTLNVTLTYDLRNSISIYDDSAIDQIADFSSRGIGPEDNLKPDVTAPGMTIFSTAMGTGNEGMNDNGTSMATPHVAGVAALVKEAHRTWYPEQIKAAIMNTADNDVFSGPTPHDADQREAPIRVGSGRVDAQRATDSDALAYSFGTGGAVSISFGTVRAASDVTRTKLFTVENDSDSDRTYDVAYVPANSGNDQSAVSYDTPSTVTVPAHGSLTVPVTLHIDASALEREADTTRTIDLGGLYNNFVTEASGWVTLGSGGNEALRLPVYTAPRPMSQMHPAGTSELDFTSGDTASLPLAGHPVDQDGFEGMVSGYALGVNSAKKPACTAASTNTSRCTQFPSDAAGDIHYVGATSDANLYRQVGLDPNQGLTYFAVSSYGPWHTPASYVEFDINLDTNNDGTADAILYNSRLTDTDAFVTELVDATTGEVLDDGNDVYILNGADGSIDTNPFDNNVMVLPTFTGALTELAPSGSLTYWVDAFSAETGRTDHTGKVKFNALHPALSVVDGPAYENDNPAACWFCGEQFFGDVPTGASGPGLTVLRDRSTYGMDMPKGLLLVHPYNALATTTQVIKVRHASTATLAVSPNPARHSAKKTATVTVKGISGLTPTGTVTIMEGTKSLVHGTLSSGKRSLTLPTLSVGTHHLKAVYSGDANYLKATSKVVDLKVTS